MHDGSQWKYSALMYVMLIAHSSKFKNHYRIASWIIGKTLARIYPEVLVRKSQLEGLRKARATGYPILYLPVHRSHVDYVLVSWVLVASDIRAPLVAAGDNLNIPIFQ